MLVRKLKWLQLVVAIASTVLAGLLWPGVMVLIPVAIGIFYIVMAATAFRDWRLSIWLACLTSAGVAVLSMGVVVAENVALFEIDAEMGEPPLAAVSPLGDVTVLDSIPEEQIAEMRRRHNSSVRTHIITVTLLILVATGSCAVILMHLFAWKWVLRGQASSNS